MTARSDVATIDEEAALVAHALAARLPGALVPLFDGAFIRSSLLYDEFVYRLALGVFREAGLETAAGQPGTAEEIAIRAGLEAGRAVQPVDWILRQLATRHVLAADGSGRVHRLEPTPVLDPGSIRDEQLRHDASWLPSYVLAETVARDYPAFLRGETTGEEILFSPARFRLWFDYFSNDNGLYAVNNRVGAIALTEWLPRAAGTIVELGGGLGSAAVAALERLGALGRLGEVGAYRFTELVPVFLRRGQRALESRFPEARFLTCSVLDMNRPFAEQGIGPGSAAVVYAVNTLHVAHDLGFTLGEVFAALEPGGRLIVSECVRPFPGQSLYPEFVFNLMESFRSPRLEAEYRPNGGFLTPEQWSRAMATAGFSALRFLPDVAALRDAFPSFYVAAIGATRPG